MEESQIPVQGFDYAEPEAMVDNAYFEDDEVISRMPPDLGDLVESGEEVDLDDIDVYGLPVSETGLDYAERQAERWNVLPQVNGWKEGASPVIQAALDAAKTPEDALAVLEGLGDDDNAALALAGAKVLENLRHLAMERKEDLPRLKENWEIRARLLDHFLNPWTPAMEQAWRQICFHDNDLYTRALSKLERNPDPSTLSLIGAMKCLYFKEVLPGLVRVVAGIPFGGTKRNKPGKNKDDYDMKLKFQPVILIHSESSVMQNGQSLSLILNNRLVKAELAVIGIHDDPCEEHAVRAKLSRAKLCPTPHPQSSSIYLRQPESDTGISAKFHGQRLFFGNPMESRQDLQSQVPDRLQLKLLLQDSSNAQFTVPVPLAGDFTPCSADPEVLGLAFPATAARASELSGFRLPASLDAPNFISFMLKCLKSVALTLAVASLERDRKESNSAAVNAEILNLIDGRMGELMRMLCRTLPPPGLCQRLWNTENFLSLEQKSAWQRLYMEARGIGMTVAKDMGALIQQGQVIV